MKIPWPKGRAEDLLQRATILVAAIGFAGLVALAIVAFVSSQQTANQALDTRDQTATSATRRITSLQRDLAHANAGITAAQAQNSELITKVDALTEQLRQMGARPVVAATSSITTTTTRRPATTGPTTTTTIPPGPAGTSPPTTQPTPDPGPGAPPAPPPSDQPAVCGLLGIPVICN